MAEKKFNLKAYLSHLSPQGKEITIPRLIETGELTALEAQKLLFPNTPEDLSRYEQAIVKNRGAGYIWQLFYNRPDYLTRALVQLMPNIFYTDGITSPIVAKLRPKLGPVVIPPRTSSSAFNPILYIKTLPERVQYDIRALYRDCLFLDYLYLMNFGMITIGLQTGLLDLTTGGFRQSSNGSTSS